EPLAHRLGARLGDLVLRRPPAAQDRDPHGAGALGSVGAAGEVGVALVGVGVVDVPGSGFRAGSKAPTVIVTVEPFFAFPPAGSCATTWRSWSRFWTGWVRFWTVKPALRSSCVAAFCPRPVTSGTSACGGALASTSVTVPPLRSRDCGVGDCSRTVPGS